MKIANLSQKLADDFGLTPVVATEIEFYLHGIEAKLPPSEIISLIEAQCAQAEIALACAEAERGPGQYEVSLPPSHDIPRVVADTERFKALTAGAFAPYGAQADFAAKPMRDAPGSGLHVHVHLEDRQRRNVFFREGEEFSPLLLNAIGGLLALMNPCMPVFAPHTQSYERFLFTANSYLICPTAANVPLTVSWGTNNRTVAVRLPSKPADNKHIEHRVSGSDADVGQVVEAILAGVHYGLARKCDPGPPVYGDATLEQYGLPALARSIGEAEVFRKQCEMLDLYR